jgi:hypothetical protein
MELFFDLVLFALLLSMFIPALSFAPWVPSPMKHLKRAFDLAKIKPGERFYDLGCGDGRAVVYAAKHFGAKATGIELAFPLYIAANIRVLLARARGATIVFGNLFKRDLSDADVIYVYGMPSELTGRLREKLERECKRGTRVISFVFEIKGWQPTAVDRPATGNRRKDIAVTLYVL